jgi:hypothetical protein
MAQVKLNGRDLGILWKSPFRTDVTGVLKSGPNALEIKIVNLWPNRMIGDEQLPEDSGPRTSPFKGDTPEMGVMQATQWPEWIREGKTSPTGRFTFTTWRLWNKNDALVPSGLIGPVTVQTDYRIQVN